MGESAVQERTAVMVQPGELIQVMINSGCGEEWCGVYRATRAINLTEDAAPFRDNLNKAERSEVFNGDWRDAWLESLEARGLLVKVPAAEISFYRYEYQRDDDFDLSITPPSR